MRASYGRGKKAYDLITAKGLRAFLPVKTTKEKENGITTIRKSYPLPSNVFVYATYEEALDISCRSNNSNAISFLDFAFDHTHTVGEGKNPIITIPTKEMERFIAACAIVHPGAHFIAANDIPYAKIRLGSTVRITRGPFKDVVGKIIRLFGKRRVAVTIPNVLCYVTAHIESGNFEIEEE